MNVIDKFINSIAPVHGMKRMAARKTMEILNTGYSHGGASYSKKSLRGFTDVSASPAQDIDANLNTLRNRSRSLYMSAPIATSAIKSSKTNVVGIGLKLKARIDYEFLGISQEDATKIEQTIEREFKFWAEDKLQCDSLRLNNFYEMQQLIFMGYLLNGDGFCLLKQEPTKVYSPYGLRLHIFESDRVCTKNSIYGLGNSGMPPYAVNEVTKNEIYSGIEINKNGAVVAYWICDKYPYTASYGNYTTPTWTRVEAFGEKTGRPNIIHIFNAERAEQRRGVPMLAPVIESIKQLTRYTEAELMAAVIAGMFTVFVKTDTPTSEAPLGSGMPDNTEDVPVGENEYEMGNGQINYMAPNESIEIADPKRPNTAFDGFVNALSRYIGAALEIPQELLQKSFNSSYSASRAALLEAWKKFRMDREWLAMGFCQVVYEQFLTEAVARSRIVAPGFFDDPIVRKAWCGADWNGPAPGMIDPVKEVMAAKMRVENGFSTREEETIGLTGGDYQKNTKQLKQENEQLAQAKRPLEPPQNLPVGQ